MYITAELILRSYQPDELEIGMYFYRIITIGVPQPIHEVWQLMELPEDDHQFQMINGAPVELCIISEEIDILAMQADIGWFDAGEDVDELYDITLVEINKIIQEHAGLLEIEIDEDSEEELAPIFIDNKIIIKYID